MKKLIKELDIILEKIWKKSSVELRIEIRGFQKALNNLSK